jgi:hypothetical protein
MLLLIAMNQETRFFTSERVFRHDLPHVLIRMTLDTQPVRLRAERDLLFEAVFQGYRQPRDE